MLTPDQLKDLATFNGFKAMQFEMLAAQQQQINQQLAEKVAVLEKQLQQPVDTKEVDRLRRMVVNFERDYQWDGDHLGTWSKRPEF